MDHNATDRSAGFAVCDVCGEKLPYGLTYCTNCGSRKMTRFGGEMARDERDVEVPYQYGVQDTYISAHPRRRRAASYAAYDEYGRDDAMEQDVSEAEYDDYEEYEEYDDPEDDEYEYEYYSFTQVIGTVASLAFMAVVLIVAIIGFGASLAVGSDTPDSSVQTSSQTKSTSSAASAGTSSGQKNVKSAVHTLPEEMKKRSYKKYTVAGNTFDTVTASSFLSGERTKGSPERAFDGDPETCWQDGVDGYGKGEWLIACNSDGKAVKVSSVTVYNGYLSEKYNTDTKDMYLLNSRVSGFTLKFDDGSSESFILYDEKEPQTFRFKERETCYVKFSIDDVYKGGKYKDTCIGEIIYQ